MVRLHNFLLDSTSKLGSLCTIIQIFHCFKRNVPECLFGGSRESLRCIIFPDAEGRVKYFTSQGFPETSRQTFLYIRLRSNELTIMLL